jgi:hypothetical protein
MHEEKITNITRKINSGSEDNNGQQVGKVNSQVIRGEFSSSYKDKDKESIFFDIFEELSNGG